MVAQNLVFFSEDKPIVLKKDGLWLHGDTHIINERVIAYFQKLIHWEDKQYFLVTQQEKVPLIVEDTPFLVKRVFFYEIDHKLEAELLLNNQYRVPLEPDNFVIRSQKEWIAYITHNGSRMPALFSVKAMIDLVSEADPEVDDDLAADDINIPETKNAKNTGKTSEVYQARLCLSQGNIVLPIQ